MKKRIFAIVLLILAFACGIAEADGSIPQPTQTPYVIYVVVTPTPEDITIRNPRESESEITIVNQGGNSSVPVIDTAETDPSGMSASDELVAEIVATLMAQLNTTAGGTEQTTGYNAAPGGAVVRQSDGSTCTMNFELVSEPSYPAGSIVPRGAVFWKEWVIRNTGTCTWTPQWSFVFDSGWQIGNTRFSMNRTTAPGETLTVRLGMTPDQKQNGNYYSTYVFEAPDGTRGGKITSSYTVKNPSYFDPKPTASPEKTKPQSGTPAGPVWPYSPCPPYYHCPPYYPCKP